MAESGEIGLVRSGQWRRCRFERGGVAGVFSDLQEAVQERAVEVETVQLQVLRIGEAPATGGVEEGGDDAFRLIDVDQRGGEAEPGIVPADQLVLAEQPAPEAGGYEAEQATRRGRAIPEQQHGDVAEVDEMLCGGQGEIGLAEWGRLDGAGAEVAPFSFDRGAASKRAALNNEAGRVVNRCATLLRRSLARRNRICGEVRHGAALSRLAPLRCASVPDRHGGAGGAGVCA